MQVADRVKKSMEKRKGQIISKVFLRFSSKSHSNSSVLFLDTEYKASMASAEDKLILFRSKFLRSEIIDG